MGCHSPLLVILRVTTHIHRVPSGSFYFFQPVRWESGLSRGGLTDRFYPRLHPQGQCAFSICPPTDGEQGSKVIPWARDGWLPGLLRESRCVPAIMTARSWFRWNGTESDGGTGSTEGKQLPRWAPGSQVHNIQRVRLSAARWWRQVIANEWQRERETKNIRPTSILPDIGTLSIEGAKKLSGAMVGRTAESTGCPRMPSNSLTPKGKL